MVFDSRLSYKDRITCVFIKGWRQPSVWLKSGGCFPDLIEIPSYIEKIEYLRRI